jgi:hypothetical protein
MPRRVRFARMTKKKKARDSFWSVDGEMSELDEISKEDFDWM